MQVAHALSEHDKLEIGLYPKKKKTTSQFFTVSFYTQKLIKKSVNSNFFHPFSHFGLCVTYLVFTPELRLELGPKLLNTKMWNVWDMYLWVEELNDQTVTSTLTAYLTPNATLVHQGKGTSTQDKYHVS